MEVRWERDLERTSLVLAEEGEGEAGGFETKMVCVGGVPGLLPMTVRQMDNKTEYVYDVTARQPLSEHLQGRLLDKGSLTEILDAVLQVIEGLAAFLLDSGHLQYASDRIFVKGGFRDLRFCYLPTQTTTMREGFYGLVMELLSKTDPKDRAAIVLGYRFAHELQGENVTLQELRELLHGEGDLSANASGETVEDCFGKEDFGVGKMGSSFCGARKVLEAGKAERAVGNVEESFGKAETTDSFDRRNRALQNGGSLFQFGEVSYGRTRKERREDFSEKGMAARLGINKRTFLIVGIGAAVLLAAYLALHTEVLDTVLKYVQENPVLLAVPIVLVAGIAFFIVLRRRKRGRPSSKGSGSPYEFSEASYESKGSDSPYHYSEVFYGSKSNSSACAFPELVQDNVGCTAASTNEPRNPSEERVFRPPLHQIAFGDEGMKKSDEESRQTGLNPNGNFRFVQNGGDDSETCLLRPAKTEAMVWLLPTGKAEAFGEIVLQKDYNIIGKQSEMVDVVLPSPVISRVHAHICRKEGTWMVADLSSRNGTFLNDEPLMPMQDMPIKDGDTLRFADLGYVFKGK